MTNAYQMRWKGTTFLWAALLFATWSSGALASRAVDPAAQRSSSVSPSRCSFFKPLSKAAPSSGSAQRTFDARLGGLKEQTSAAERTKPYLGMTVEDITPKVAGEYNLSETNGVAVTAIEPDTPGYQAGLKRGKAIYEIFQISVIFA